MVPDNQRLPTLFNIAEDEVTRAQTRADGSQGIWARRHDPAGLRARADAEMGLPPVDYGPLVWTEPYASSSDIQRPRATVIPSSTSTLYSCCRPSLSKRLGPGNPAPSFPLFTLPTELQTEIISCFAIKSLNVFARCSMECLEKALPILYRELMVPYNQLHERLESGVRRQHSTKVPLIKSSNFGPLELINCSDLVMSGVLSVLQANLRYRIRRVYDLLALPSVRHLHITHTSRSDSTLWSRHHHDKLKRINLWQGDPRLCQLDKISLTIIDQYQPAPEEAMNDLLPFLKLLNPRRFCISAVNSSSHSKSKPGIVVPYGFFASLSGWSQLRQIVLQCEVSAKKYDDGIPEIFEDFTPLHMIEVHVLPTLAVHLESMVQYHLTAGLFYHYWIEGPVIVRTDHAKEESIRKVKEMLSELEPSDWELVDGCGRGWSPAVRLNDNIRIMLECVLRSSLSHQATQKKIKRQRSVKQRLGKGLFLQSLTPVMPVSSKCTFL